jgi:dolichyl-phosphate-mannose--protein O-mannosyl transferase
MAAPGRGEARPLAVGWRAAVSPALDRLVVPAAFAVLLALHAADPPALVFDEIHYVPAARALASLADDLNWTHPPLSKWILGLGERALCGLHLACGPAAPRVVTAAFGLWALATVGGFLRDLGFSAWAARYATWLTGFGVLWFVQSRTAMPDVFAVAFALAGLRRVRRPGPGPGPWIGWAWLGLAMACKWSAAPFCVLAALWSPLPPRRRGAGVALAVLAYAAPFLPLALLARGATGPLDVVGYQLRMLEGFGRVDLTNHPYASRPWQWPTLLRPIWYHFERGPAGDRYVWAGGNPLLFACALPATVWLAARALRRDAADPAARTLALLYWAPMLFWAALPRAQVYYYFLPAAMWLGPAVVWAALRLGGRRPRATRAALLVLVLACAALFAWFAPLLDGRLQPVDAYNRRMWLTGWR